MTAFAQAAPEPAPAPAPPAPEPVAQAAPKGPPPAAARREPVPAETLKAMQMRARSEHAVFLAASAKLIEETEPTKLIAATDPEVVEMGAETAKGVVKAIVEPGVIGAAATKLAGVAGYGEKLKGLFNSGQFDDLGAKAAAPLVSARLEELTAMSQDGAADDALSDSAKLAKLASVWSSLDKLPADMLGKRTYLSTEEKARVRLARANLSDSAGKPKKDALLQAGRQLSKDLLDARLRDLVEKDPALSAFYTGTEAPIAAATTAAIRGRKDLLNSVSATMSGQLRDWGMAMANLTGDIASGSNLSESELNILMGAVSNVSGATTEMLAGIGPKRKQAVAENPALLQVATRAAAAEAAKEQTKAEAGVRKYIEKNTKSYEAKKKAVDEDVKSDLQAMAGIGPMTAMQKAVTDKAKAEISSAADGATSRLSKVGTALDAALPGPNGSKAGGSTSADVVIQIPVAAFPGAFLGVRIHVEAERSFAGHKPETSIGAELGLQAGGSLPLAAKALVELGGYFKAVGGTAAEAMEYISYALFRRFRESPLVLREITNSIWGAGGVTAGKGESSSQAKHAEANAWGAGMEKRLGANASHSAETGGYVAARGEVGQGTGALGGAGIGAKASLAAQFGTKYSAGTVKEGRDAGRGAVVEGRGAEKSVGQRRMNFIFDSEVSAPGFGGSATVSGTYARSPGKDTYLWDSLTISLSGVGKAPAESLLGGAKNSTLSISNWVATIIGKIRTLIYKAQEKERTEIPGLEKKDVSKTLALSAPTAYKINEATGGAAAEKGWYEAVSKYAGTSSGGGGALSGAKKAVVSGAKDTIKTVKDATGFASQGSVNITAKFALDPSGSTLQLSLGSQSEYAADMDVVTVSIKRIDNLVTVLLLPTVKVLV